MTNIEKECLSGKEPLFRHRISHLENFVYAGKTHLCGTDDYCGKKVKISRKNFCSYIESQKKDSYPIKLENIYKNSEDDLK